MARGLKSFLIILPQSLACLEPLAGQASCKNIFEVKEICLNYAITYMLQVTRKLNLALKMIMRIPTMVMTIHGSQVSFKNDQYDSL